MGLTREKAEPGEKMCVEPGGSYPLHRDIPVVCGKGENMLGEKGPPIPHLLLVLEPSRPECMSAGFQEPPSGIHALSSSSDLYS